MDKERAALKDSAREAKRARRTRVPTTLAHWKTIAEKTVVGNDKTFVDMSNEEKQRRADLEKLSSHRFWEKLKVKDGFKEQLEIVLPGFWKDEYKNKKPWSKAKLLPEIVAYLGKVTQAAENPALPCDMTSEDITAMDKWDILELFVKLDATTHLDKNRTASKLRQQTIAKMIKSNGVKCKKVVYSKTALQHADAISYCSESESSSNDS